MNWRPAGRHLLPFLAAALLLAVPAAQDRTSSAVAAELVRASIGATASGPWSPVDLSPLRLAQGHAFVRVVFDVHPDQRASPEPLGLYLSGTFSAAATWNGIAIGNKGVPGKTRVLEQPGRIDAALPIPQDALKPGENQLILEMASHYRMPGVSSVFNGTRGRFGLHLAPYSSHWHRSLGYYVVPSLVLGLFAAALVASLTYVQFEDRTDQRIAFAAAATLLTLAGAEISRSVVNFPYPLQAFRLSVLLSASVMLALLLVVLAKRASTVRWPTRYALPVGALVIIGATLVPGWFDARTAAAIGAGAASGIVLNIAGIRQRNPSSIAVCAVLALILALAVYDPGQFMDRALYAAALPLLAIVFRTRASRPRQNQSGHLIVHSGADQTIVNLQEIRAIHGAGNYAEFELENGKRIMEKTSLSRLSNELPANFCRIHRSHIVDIHGIRDIRSLGGGRYEVGLLDGSRLPWRAPGRPAKAAGQCDGCPGFSERMKR